MKSQPAIETPTTPNAVEALYELYIEGDERLYLRTTQEESDVSRLGKEMDEKVDAHTVTTEDTADYEEAARRAGFYAGVRAAGAIYAQARAFTERSNENVLTGKFNSLNKLGQDKAIAYIDGLLTHSREASL